MDLNLLSITPDIAEVKRAARRQGNSGPLAVNAVSDIHTGNRNKAVHCAVLCHLDLPLAAPDGARRRFLPGWLGIIPVFTGRAGSVHGMLPGLCVAIGTRHVIRQGPPRHR